MLETEAALVSSLLYQVNDSQRSLSHLGQVFL